MDGEAKSMREEQMLFSGKDLQKMIIPLFLEQLLIMLVGMAETRANQRENPPASFCSFLRCFLF